MAKKIAVSELIIREQLSHRGGGVEIDLTRKGFKGQKMTAYQNYLGGGMLGSIQNDCTKRNWQDDKKLVRIAKDLREYLYSVTHPDSEWDEASLEQLQLRSASAY